MYSGVFETLDGLLHRFPFVIWVVFKGLFNEAKSSCEFQLRAIPITILEVRSIDSNELFHVAALDKKRRSQSGYILMQSQPGSSVLPSLHSVRGGVIIITNK